MRLANCVKARLGLSGLLTSILYCRRKLEPFLTSEKRAIFHTFNTFLDIDSPISEEDVKFNLLVSAYSYYLNKLNSEGKIDNTKEEQGKIMLNVLDKMNNSISNIKRDTKQSIDSLTEDLISFLDLFKKERGIPILDGARFHLSLLYFASALDVDGYGFFDRLWRGRWNTRKLRRITEKIQRIEKDQKIGGIDKKRALESLCDDAIKCAADLRYYSYNFSEDPSLIKWNKIKEAVEQRASLKENLLEYIIKIVLLTEDAEKTTLYVPLPENNIETFARNIALQIALPAKYKLNEETLSKLVEYAMKESEEEKIQFSKFVEAKKGEIGRDIADTGQIKKYFAGELHRKKDEQSLSTNEIKKKEIMKKMSKNQLRYDWLNEEE